MKKRIFIGFEGTLYDGANFCPAAKSFCSTVSSKPENKLSILTNCTRFSNEELTNMIKTELCDSNICEIITIFSLLKNRHFSEKHPIIFAMVSDGFYSDLVSLGITVYRPKDHTDIEKQVAENIQLFDGVSAVLIGNDEQFNFCSVSLATRYVLEKKATLYTVGKDRQFLRGNGNFVPGPYTFSAPVRSAAEIEGEVIGKPNLECLENLGIERKTGAEEDKEEIWIIGDNLETDIKLANDAKAKSILVLTGVSTEEDISAHARTEWPTCICKELEDGFF